MSCKAMRGSVSALRLDIFGEVLAKEALASFFIFDIACKQDSCVEMTQSANK